MANKKELAKLPEELKGTMAVSEKALTLALLDGEPNIQRALALLADKDLKDRVTVRNMLLIQYGIKKVGASAKGLMIQINSRINKELGVSIAENPHDELLQSWVSNLRSTAAMVLKRHCDTMANTVSQTDDADKARDEILKSDAEVKRKIYELIQRSSSDYNDIFGGKK
jgi:hypothetical protein